MLNATVVMFMAESFEKTGANTRASLYINNTFIALLLGYLVKMIGSPLHFHYFCGSIAVIRLLGLIPITLDRASKRWIWGSVLANAALLGTLWMIK